MSQNIINRKNIYVFDQVMDLIVTDVEIYTNDLKSKMTCGALWDTGATYCLVSDKIINQLNLQAIDRVKTSNAAGDMITDLYSIGVSIPNFVSFGGILATHSEMKGYDFIIGMNLIKKGDFSINNYGGKTTFSFTYPPEKIDE